MYTTECKTAKTINGTIKVGDKVINVPQGHGARAFYGTVTRIYKRGVGCTMVNVKSNIGDVHYPASLLHKGAY